MSAVTGVAAGVPFFAVAPRTPGTGAVVVAWHPMDAPCTEAAFAAALPLAGLDAWRIYLGLPMYGSRLPAGGMDALMRLGFEDAVLRLQGPIITQAAAEFPAAYAELCERLSLGRPAVGLLGGSGGSAVAQLVLTETAPAAAIPVAAAVLYSPIGELRAAVDATARHFGIAYAWGPESSAVADRMDFVARADDFLRAGQPAVRLIVGAADDEAGFHEPAGRLRAALSERYADPTRVDLVVVPGMAHSVAEPPGIAAAVDRHAVAWLRNHLRA